MRDDDVGPKSRGLDGAGGIWHHDEKARALSRCTAEVVLHGSNPVDPAFQPVPVTEREPDGAGAGVEDGSEEWAGEIRLTVRCLELPENDSDSEPTEREMSSSWREALSPVYVREGVSSLQPKLLAASGEFRFQL